MERIIVFGTGKGAVDACKYYELDKKYEIIAYADNDALKRGKEFAGKLVINPKEINSLEYDLIIVCSMYYREIKEQLINKIGITPSKIKQLEYLEVKNMKKEYNCKESDEIFDYIEKNEVKIFNYEFDDLYNKLGVEVFYDNNVEMFYVIHFGKKMYFKKSFDDKKKVIEYYRSICKEQDIKSPHLYLNEERKVRNGDIVIDAGVAEGNFALSVIDDVSKIYLVEVDDEWIVALKETFKDYMDKVVIIEKFLSDHSDDKNITIDDILNGEKVDFVKLDIEGYEVDALIGAHDTLRKQEATFVVCSYHNKYDEEKIKGVFDGAGYSTYTTNGYMLLNLDFRPDIHRTNFSLRRGLVVGTK